MAVPIVDPASFQIVPAADDPLEVGTSSTATGTPSRGRCGPEAAVVEDLGVVVTYSIVTRDCARLTVEAPIQEAVRPGESVELRIWHYPLLPYGPAEARLLVLLEGQSVWSRVVAIPAQSELLRDQFRLEAGAKLGESLRWHVSNHGVNSWNWVSATVPRARPCPQDAAP